MRNAVDVGIGTFELHADNAIVADDQVRSVLFNQPLYLQGVQIVCGPVFPFVSGFGIGGYVVHEKRNDVDIADDRPGVFKDLYYPINF